MRIYTKAGDLAFKTFSFPDGQPHFKMETYEREFNEVTIEMALRSPNDLFTLTLANYVLRFNGYSIVNLDIRYLLGARMDRIISCVEPFTLSVVAGIINGCGFSKVRVLDAHSEAATRLIRNCTNILPRHAATTATVALKFPIIVCPDKGAMERTFNLGGPFIQCEKTRDPDTGALTGFKVTDNGPRSLKHVRGNPCLILDDICDGGGTFSGIADKLREIGATSVNLFVTHGIFSKGPDALKGIDKIFTTDSYCTGQFGYVPVIPVVVIPISMKEL